MILSKPGKLPGVEAWRGVAALLVVTVHVTSILAQRNLYNHPVLDGLFIFGHSGVDFFFVLSGFIIAYIHSSDAGKPSLIGKFWRKRLWRIFPLYWLVTLSFQTLLVFSPTQDRAEQDLWHIAASWLLFPELAPPILGVGWSLRHELLFYALFSCLILNRRAGIVLFSLWGAACLWNAVFMVNTGRFYFTGVAGGIVFRTFNLEFFLGMAVASLVRRPAWQPRLLLLGGTLLFLGTGIFERYGPPLLAEWPPQHARYALGAALMLYGTACLDLSRRWTVPGWAVALGGASYSIYLVHVPVALVVAELIRRGRAVMPIPIELAFVTIVGTATLAGLIVHRLVERPVMRYAARINNRPVPVTP